MLHAVAQCDASTADIILTEIMYNPCELGDGSGQGSDTDFEFIEIYNRGASGIDIAGWSFTGVTYTFPAGTSLDPGQYALIGRDIGQLAACGTCLRGEFTGSLTNGGETVTLDDCNGNQVFSVTYNDSDGKGASGENWTDCADGRCASLSLDDLTLSEPALYAFDNWMPGKFDRDAGTFGTPGLENESGCCLLTGFAEIECDGTSFYRAVIPFSDGCINRDDHTISTTAGMIAGADPDASGGGAILIEMIPIGSSATVTISSIYGCDVEFILEPPDCQDDCELELVISAECTDNDNAIEEYYLAIDVIESNPNSTTVDIYLDDVFFANYNHADLPDTLFDQDGTDYELICVQAVDPTSLPKLTLTELMFDNGPEHVEITNTGVPIDLLNYKIADDFYFVNGRVRHIFVASTIIGTNQTIRINVTDMDEDGDGIPNTETTIFNNDGDFALLLDAASEVVSSLSYDVSDMTVVTRDPLDPTAFCADTACFEEPCLPSVMWARNLEMDLSYEQQTVTVRWTVQAEWNLSHYIVEHSADGRSWSAVAQIPSRNASSNQEYIVDHSTFSRGINYYRITQLSQVGDQLPGVIASIRISDAQGRQTYRQGQLYYQLDEPATLRIFSIDGRQVMERVLASSGSISLDRLPIGVYISALYSTAGEQISVERYLVD